MLYANDFTYFMPVFDFKYFITVLDYTIHMFIVTWRYRGEQAGKLFL